MVSGGAATDALILTELLSNQEYGSGEDFWELTNTGLVPVNLGDWSWDDDSRAAGTVAIPAGTYISSGESVIFTSMDAAGFRAWWGLPETVQVISDANAPGFGKNDGVALFDADSNELFFFTYAAAGFTLSGGGASLGGHAGGSAGGNAELAIARYRSGLRHGGAALHLRHDPLRPERERLRHTRQQRPHRWAVRASISSLKSLRRLSPKARLVPPLPAR